jgi:hypothetical protein
MWFNDQCSHFKAVKNGFSTNGQRREKNSLVILGVVLDEGDCNKMAPNSAVEEVLDEEEGHKKGRIGLP